MSWTENSNNLKNTKYSKRERKGVKEGGQRKGVKEGGQRKGVKEGGQRKGVKEGGQRRGVKEGGRSERERKEERMGSPSKWIHRFCV